MQTFAADQSQGSAAASRPDATSGTRRAVVAVVAVGVLWFILCRHLSSEWSMNEQYSYGWFVPFFAAYLFWLRWEDRQGESGRNGCAATAGLSKAKLEIRRSEGKAPRFLLSTFHFLLCFALLSALLPIRLTEGANPDWRPLSWLHALCVVGITLILIYKSGGKSRLRHFAFPVLFILMAVPWVTPIEQPIVQGLMRTVAAFTTEILNLCGVPAELQGNLIRLPTGTVGVNEACSGVRSLQTSLMIGLLFGELKRLTTRRRIALVGIAGALAIFANFLRALFLVGMAARDVSALEAWHDRAGYAILLLVFLGTLWVAARLTNKPSTRNDPPSRERTPFDFRTIPAGWCLFALAWLVASEVAVEAWYRSHERNFTALPRWTVAWPVKANGYRESPIDDRTRAVLLFDEGRQATWNAPPTDADFATPAKRCNAFFFRWNPGGTSVIRARAHRPDICLPSAGWRLTSDEGLRSYAGDDGLALPFRHFRFVNASGAVTVDTFFCVYEDRDARWADLATYSPDEQTSYAARWRNVKDGIRNMGQQVLQVTIFSTHPPSPVAAESEFAAVVRTLISPAAAR